MMYPFMTLNDGTEIVHSDVQTGDNAGILTWGIVMLLAVSGIAVMVIYSRTKKYNR